MTVGCFGLQLLGQILPRTEPFARLIALAFMIVFFYIFASIIFRDTTESESKIIAAISGVLAVALFITSIIAIGWEDAIPLETLITLLFLIIVGLVGWFKAEGYLRGG